jgi:hypothetical protein
MNGALVGRPGRFATVALLWALGVAALLAVPGGTLAMSYSALRALNVAAGTPAPALLLVLLTIAPRLARERRRHYSGGQSD